MLSNPRHEYNFPMPNRKDLPQYSDEELGSFETLMSIVELLRAPGGCPWDREQTHSSLKRNLLEESYEVLEAIDGGDAGALSEELGDLLVQVAFHTQIAKEAGVFDLAHVLTQINEKLVRRHPHVFGDETAADAREVERNWEKIKQAEQDQAGVQKSPVDGIPKDLPALTHAQLLQDRVGHAGFEWEEVSGVLDKLVEEVEELRRSDSHEQKVQELGDVFFVLVNLARWMDIHAEDALRLANRRFATRYRRMEELAAGQGLDFAALSLTDKETFWQEAKRMEEG